MTPKVVVCLTPKWLPTELKYVYAVRHPPSPQTEALRDLKTRLSKNGLQASRSLQAFSISTRKPAEGDNKQPKSLRGAPVLGVPRMDLHRSGMHTVTRVLGGLIRLAECSRGIRGHRRSPRPTLTIQILIVCEHNYFLAEGVVLPTKKKLLIFSCMPFPKMISAKNPAKKSFLPPPLPPPSVLNALVLHPFSSLPRLLHF